MRTTLILAALAAFAFAGVADAKSCKDAQGKFVKCPAPAAAAAKPAATKAPAAPAAKSTMSKTKAGTTFKAPAATPKTASTTGGAPHCTKGKPCGKSCIAMDKVCHK